MFKTEILQSTSLTQIQNQKSTTNRSTDVLNVEMDVQSVERTTWPIHNGNRITGLSDDTILQYFCGHAPRGLEILTASWVQWPRGVQQT